MTLHPTFSFGRGVIDQDGLHCGHVLQRRDGAGQICGQLLAGVNEQGLVCGLFRCPKCNSDVNICLVESTGRVRLQSAPARS